MCRYVNGAEGSGGCPKLVTVTYMDVIKVYGKDACHLFIGSVIYAKAQYLFQVNVPDMFAKRGTPF